MDRDLRVPPARRAGPLTQRRLAAFTLIELLVIIAIIAIIAAVLFPVFASARDKARQAACMSNLKQIGHALQLYLQDYDERLPNCCSHGRVDTWTNYGSDLTGRCFQEGITRATPVDTILGPEQNPPRYVQELLHPYVRNAVIWFCPSVEKDRHPRGDPTIPTYGFNGTSYLWNHVADPTTSTDPNPFRNRGQLLISGLPIAAIPRLVEAPLMWDAPHWNPISDPCTRLPGLRPAHAKGLNVLYVDTHVKFNPFTNRPSKQESPPCQENWYFEHNWEGFYE